MYGSKCVLPPADRYKNSFSTVIVVNNDAANIQVKVIIFRDVTSQGIVLGPF